MATIRIRLRTESIDFAVQVLLGNFAVSHQLNALRLLETEDSFGYIVDASPTVYARTDKERQTETR